MKFDWSAAGFILSFATVCLGGVVWLSAVAADAAYARRKVDVIERVEKRLIRIEVKLGIDGPLQD